MVIVRFAVLALVSLVFPGAGHAALGERRHGVLWCAAGLAALFAIAATLWALPMSLAIRATCVIDLIRAARAKPTGKLDVLGGGGIALLTGAAFASAFAFAVGIYRVPSESMSPALAAGDAIVVSHLSSSVARAQIVVFDHPCEHVPYVKRVIALPGEAVEVRCNAVYVDGVRLDGMVDHRDREADFPTSTDLPACPGAPALGSYRAARPRSKLPVDPKTGATDPCEQTTAYVVPPGHVFVLGDNRDHSFDSRTFGAVPIDAVTGRVLGIAWPLSRLADL